MIIIFYSGRLSYCPSDYIFNNSARYNQRIDENRTGYLEIIIYDNMTNAPIEGAIVTIASVIYSGQFNEFGDGRVLYEYKTDENGIIPITQLPIHNELNINHRHNFYIVTVFADGYIDVQLYHIQIFEDETTTFRLFLSRMVDDKKRFNIIIQPTTEEIHSR